MKKVTCVVVFCWLGLSLLAQDAGFRVVGTGSVLVPVTGRKMTNLVFPVAVESAVKVSRDVLMQRPKGVTNVIELKAVRSNFPPTNISVYGRDGRPYSFVLRYVEDTAVLNYWVVPDSAFGEVVLTSMVRFSGLPVNGVMLDSDAAVLSAHRAFLHESVSASGVRMHLRGAYLRDSLLWLCLGLTNRVEVGFTPSYVRVYVEDKKQVKRMASQQAVILPVYQSALAPVPGLSHGVLALGLEPMVVPSGKRLVVELADASGGRVLLLTVKGKKLLRARKEDR
jgi:hypothetical protein